MVAQYSCALESLVDEGLQAFPLVLIRASELRQFKAKAPDAIRDWIDAAAFDARRHSWIRLPDAPRTVLVGLGEALDRWSLSHLPQAVGCGVYALEPGLSAADASTAALSWVLGAYRFDVYRTLDAGPVAKLCWPALADRAIVTRDAGAVVLARDLINTPANDLGPADLDAVVRAVAAEFGAEVTTIVGDGLITENYPLIHAVGRGSDQAPRLIDMVWGEPSAPRVTLVGKGVCFDTGGLNLKPGATMITMKNDMGGAATALALAKMVMTAKLPVRLRLLIPAVENSISAAAYRPSDVIRSRKGLTVEVADTDAEGRLILADALAEASRERPELLIDFATLTGATVAALGPDVPSMFCNDDELAAALETAGRVTGDPLWRLPLWHEYGSDLKGQVADLTHLVNLYFGTSKMAGAIYAALFLEHFVEPDVRWVHIDTFGWNARGRPGRPEGGEVRNLFTFFHLLGGWFPADAALTVAGGK